MKLRGSHLVALAILAAVGGWMFTGQLILGGQADPNAKTIVEREAERTQEAFRVRVAEIQPSQRVETLTVRGRTQSDAIVSVRAETGGTVETRLVKKGDFVEAGDLLCEIDKGVREVQLTQAQTLLEQATADYEASEKLVKRGFATSSRLRSLKAAMDSAKFSVATAKQEMKRTEVRASVSGQVQSPLAEVGDNLAAGGVCVTLIDTDPMLFSGQLPEREISSVKVGMDATVTLISGAEVDGKIRFISRVADPNTRTFTIEIEMPNKDKSIRDGLTAEASIGLSPTDAYQLKPSWLTLEDDGF
jgi:multidrug efflux system membrane fusion protein